MQWLKMGAAKGRCIPSPNGSTRSQIIRSTLESFESKTVDHVRVIDGRTGYHMVTGDPNALSDLFGILPDVFDAVVTEKISNPYHFNWPEDRITLDRVFNASYPSESAHSAD